MKRLYAPWRAKYVKKSDKGCPFCAAVTSNSDAESFVLARYEHVLVMLNRYPYNAGHILVIPKEHQPELADLAPEVRAELMEAATKSMQVLQQALNCEGVNMGFNFGKASGGSIPEHLHMHVLPRWQGDTNFLSAICQTKLISFDMTDMYEKLKAGF